MLVFIQVSDAKKEHFISGLVAFVWYAIQWFRDVRLTHYWLLEIQWCHAELASEPDKILLKISRVSVII